jgi:hypothetical protein
VTWINQVNAVVVGDELRKQGGCDGCQDAGAVSSQHLTSGDGYVEVTATDVSALRWIGLSQGDSGTTANEIAYALRLGSGYVEVRERGAYRSDTGIAVGDVLRVEVSGGQIVYRKNGVAFYTSTVAPSYPLLVDTSLHSAGASLARVLIASAAASSGDGGTTPAPAPAPAPSLSGMPLVNWTHLRNVTVEPDALRKTGGCFGCADASAVSVETIDDASGYIEFTGLNGGPSIVGFTRRTTPQPRDFDYALRMTKGVAEVREKGIQRGEVSFAGGDVFRITVAGGRITYAKNGVVFRTSTTKTVPSVRAGALLYITNDEVSTPAISR